MSIGDETGSSIANSTEQKQKEERFQSALSKAKESLTITDFLQAVDAFVERSSYHVSNHRELRDLLHLTIAVIEDPNEISKNLPPEMLAFHQQILSTTYKVLLQQIVLLK